MHRKIACFAIFALLLTLPATAGIPRVGEAPPPLQILEVIQGAEDLDRTLSSLEGRVVVVDFFGTWCAGCIEALPHANDVVERFASRGLDYLFVSAETPDTLREFVGKNEVRPAVLIDDRERTVGDWGIGQWPTAVVIGRDGRVAAITHPMYLTDDVLEQLLEGKGIDVPAVALRIPGSLDWESTAKVAGDPKQIVAQAILRASPATEAVIRLGDDGSIVADGASMTDLLALVGEARTVDVAVELPEYDEGRRFRVSVRPGDGDTATARRQLQQLIESSFGASIRFEKREGEFAVVKRLPGTEPPKQSEFQGTGGGKWLDGEVALRAAPIDFLARLVAIYAYEMGTEWSLDETGLTGAYDFTFQYDPASVESLSEQLAAFGLGIAREQRSIPAVKLVAVSDVEAP